MKYNGSAHIISASAVKEHVAINTDSNIHARLFPASNARASRKLGTTLEAITATLNARIP